jgi:integrase
VKPFKRGNTYWVDLRRYGQGRRSLETTDKREAEVRARAAERAAWEGRLMEPTQRGGPTVEEAFDAAMREHKGWKLSKSPETIRLHYRAFEAEFGATTRLGDITRERVAAWVARLEREGKAGSTINARLTILRVLRDRADLDPLKLPAVAPSGRRQRIISDAEVEGMVCKLDRHTGALVRFLRATGARLGEALTATAEQIDRDIPALLLPTSKNKRPRAIPLTREALAVLGGRPATGKLWPGMTRSIAAKRWAAARDALGLAGDREFVIHALRHTVATELTKHHGIAVAKAWLGHSSLATTDRYAHLNVKEIITLAERHSGGETVPEERSADVRELRATR